jgi:hypothetical protein
MKQIETVNEANQLSGHRVSTLIHAALVEASLDLTRVLFPYEPTAQDTLGEAYHVLTSGQSRYGDCELMEYFIYTLGPRETDPVVGASGFYRLVEETKTTEAILRTLRTEPPRSVAFLRDNNHAITDFLWGGRLCIEPRTARSPTRMPFIIYHILSTAQRIIDAKGLAPVILAFTMRDNNTRVKQFYAQLGFEGTGASLTYGGQIQDVLVLNLSPDSAFERRLMNLMNYRSTDPR